MMESQSDSVETSLAAMRSIEDIHGMWGWARDPPFFPLAGNQSPATDSGTLRPLLARSLEVSVRQEPTFAPDRATPSNG